MRASVAAEKAGIPAVSIVASQFLALADKVATGLGAAHPVIAEFPGVPMMDSDEQLHAKVVNELLPRILEGFRNRAPAVDTKVQAPPEPESRDIVFRGTLQEVQDYFDEKLWADGLPVIPPTIERVEAFLR